MPILSSSVPILSSSVPILSSSVPILSSSVPRLGHMKINEIFPKANSLKKNYGWLDLPAWKIIEIFPKANSLKKKNMVVGFAGLENYWKKS